MRPALIITNPRHVARDRALEAFRRESDDREPMLTSGDSKSAPRLPSNRRRTFNPVRPGPPLTWRLHGSARPPPGAVQRVQQVTIVDVSWTFVLGFDAIFVKPSAPGAPALFLRAR